MDLEQLKMILETVGNATGAAYTIGGWLIVRMFLESLLGYAVGFTALVILYKCILMGCKMGQDHCFSHSLREMISPGSSGDLYPGEMAAIKDTLKKGLEKEN